REGQARLVQAERDMDRTQLIAPYSGRVRSEEVDIGQFVSRGDRLAKIYAVDFAEVRLPIPDVELQYLDLPLHFQAEDDGPTVRLSARFAGERRQWQGRVVRTEGEIDPKSRMIHIVARVDDPYRIFADEQARGTPLAVGLFVEAEILGRTVEDVMLVPRHAFRGDDRVLVVSPDHRLHLRAVEVLRWEGDDAVVASGLRDGELVCVSPIQAVVDRMKVRVEMDSSEVAAAGALP
ncbi:MAG: efflux RND transporter periplasmic adaptor subunit, partial [bacterium]|nr:efflux RND transporter periplasmic adaptor subunit [bacterium]